MNYSNQNWPTNIDYARAIARPDLFLADTDLKQCQPEKNKSNRPIPWSGNFAIVFKLKNKSNSCLLVKIFTKIFKLKNKSNSSWAVKCFTTPPPTDAESRYTAISQHLMNQTLQWLIDFDYQTQGILINSKYYPIVKMEWVKGKRIDLYITHNLSKPQALKNLYKQIHSLQQALRYLQIAHGDLQHGNILVTQSGEIKLVDYDGMYVPALSGNPPPENGHRNYQHHNRSSKDYNEQVDDFSFDVIMLSLASAIIEPNLWTKFHLDDDNFLFRKADFEKPDQSNVFRSIAQINDPDVQFLLQRLICRCKNLPLPTAPTVNIPPTGTLIISRPWPFWLTKLLVQIRNQFLLLGIVFLLILGVYWLVKLWNNQNKLTPIQTVEKFYETAPSNGDLALKLGNNKFKSLSELDSNFEKSAVEKVELLDIQSLGQSDTNISLKIFIKYLMKDGTSKCEPRIIEFIFDKTQNKWLINNNIKLLESCPTNLKLNNVDALKR